MLKAEGISWLKDGIPILSELNFHLGHGELVGLVGPNGSGKSSLLKILAFLELPTVGRLFLHNQVIPRKVSLAQRRKIAVVFQEPLLLNSTVFENVAVGLKIRGVCRSEIRHRVEHWLECFGIAHLHQQHAALLSGGEAQRVSLARAFVLEPDILFLDEPFSALDAPTKESLLTDLSKIFATSQTTVVIVSHDFRDVEILTKRVIILIKGKIVADGSPVELLQSEQPEEVEKFLAHWKNDYNLKKHSLLIER